MPILKRIKKTMLDKKGDTDMVTPDGRKIEPGHMIEIKRKGRKGPEKIGELATIIHISKRKVLVQYKKNGFYESFLRVDVENDIDRVFSLKERVM